MELYNLKGVVDVVTGTLGKSLGSSGGFIVVSDALEPVFRYLFCLPVTDLGFQCNLAENFVNSRAPSRVP